MIKNGPISRNDLFGRQSRYLLLLFFMTIAGCSNNKEQQIAVSASGISVTIAPRSGSYTINEHNPEWTFKGSLNSPLSNIKTVSGQDSIGAYHAIRFSWASDHSYQGAIRRYDTKPVVLFVLQSPDKVNRIKTIFPSFHSFPDSMHHYSFKDDVFAPPAFKLTQTSTPWLFFNNRDEAFILSPASDFMVSKMTAKGDSVLNSGLNARLTNLPADFTHKTILVFGKSIHATWKNWGNAMMKMYGKQRPGNESDPILKYYGYWTDNGADYYYNYDKSKGYGGTLREVLKQYKKEGIPIGYMQLDSWWYEKSIYGPDGKPDAGHKNRNLPQKGSWNNYGGLLAYRADKQVFPDGLTHFGQSVGIPLIVHNRWIDPRSPYHQKYKITGFAAIDPAFWNHIDSSIAAAGVIDYEQDWLNVIYNHTPKMASDLSVGNAFTDDMAQAAKSHGLDMQYCMAMPRYFMQGLKYPNLTTIRTSDDRFEPRKWRHFIYTSQLAYTMGIWPWSDVFMSHEMSNLIVSVLSSGPVGTGDKLGNEVKANIMKATRPDGILVKPDAPLLPMDSDYIHEANHIHQPMLAFTYTQQNNVRTDYVFAFTPEKATQDQYSFTPSGTDLGMQGPVVIYNPLTGDLKEVNADSTFTNTLANGAVTETMEKTGNTRGDQYRYAYYMIAPVTPIGIAFLGDEGKITATGRQRIPELSSTTDELQVQVAFAKGESPVTLHGYYEKPFKTDNGQLQLHPDQHMFTLLVSAPRHSDHVTIHFTPK